LATNPSRLPHLLVFLNVLAYAPAGLDIAVESFDAEQVALARFVGISVQMPTALRIGVRVAERIGEINAT
jgi:hypothetical protein